MKRNVKSTITFLMVFMLSVFAMQRLEINADTATKDKVSYDINTKQSVGEISGMIFKDKDQNGIYTDEVDVIAKNIEVVLYKMDENGNYHPYIDPNTFLQAKTVTDSDGKYKFDNLPKGKFKVDFSAALDGGEVFTSKKVDKDYKMDSDVDLTGVTQSIDSTKSSSRYVYAGLLDYNPSTDLKISVDETDISILGKLNGVGTTDPVIIYAKVEPLFFTTIADKSYDEDGIKVESSDNSVVVALDKAGLVDMGDYLELPIGIMGVKTGSGVVTVSIKDKYGEIKSVNINVRVLPNTRPVISASDTTLGVGDTSFTGLESLASISDDEDGTTGLSVSVKSDGGFDINTVGEYTVVYESNTLDKDGNKALDKTIKVKVVNADKPELIITSENNLTINPTKITLSVVDDTIEGLSYDWSVRDINNTEVGKGNTSNIDIPTIEGKYTLKASAKGLVNNVSEEKTFVFTVDKTGPTISTSKEEYAIKIGSTMMSDSDLKTIFGVKAEDKIDGTINNISVENDIDTSKIGDYLVTFKAKDNALNEKTKIVKIKVIPLVLSGVVYNDTNYNSTKDDTGIVPGVTIRLLDNDTNKVLAETKTDNAGKYKFSLPTGSETTTNYVVNVVEKAGFVLANKGSGSIIDTSSKVSDVLKLKGKDYTNKNIGMGKDIIASIAPNTLSLYVGETVTGSISITDGKLISIKSNNTNVKITYNSRVGFDIKGLSAGTSKITVTFKDKYSRNSITNNLDITIIKK